MLDVSGLSAPVDNNKIDNESLNPLSIEHIYYNMLTKRDVYHSSLNFHHETSASYDFNTREWAY